MRLISGELRYDKIPNSQKHPWDATVFGLHRIKKPLPIGRLALRCSEVFLMVVRTGPVLLATKTEDRAGPSYQSRNNLWGIRPQREQIICDHL